MVTTRTRLAGALVALTLVAASSIAAQAPAAGSALTLISRDGQRTLATTIVGGQQMVALDDLAGVFQLAVREDALAGGLTVTYKGQTIVLTAAQGLASVRGRLISLPAPPARQGRRWLVPVEFINRALALVYDTKLELRKLSGLVIVGDLRVPRVVGVAEPLGAQARVTFDVTPATPHTIAQEPGRLSLKFDADALDVTLPQRVSGDLVTAVRVADPSSTVAIDLGPRFATFRATALPGDGSARIVIDLLPAASTTEPPAPAPPSPPAPEAPPLIDLTPASPIRTIVVDPGHGGDEEGAKGPSGTVEKTVTLAVARRLKAAIESRLGSRVILTRDDDEPVRLDERAAIANNNKADVFISLHVNASVRTATTGAEVFYLSIDEYGDEARRLAAAEGQSLPVVGGGSREIEIILWEMAQVRYLEQSAALAQIVESELRARVPISARAIQQAPFRVLVGANMPAVLIEMGFISNPEQERQLTSDAFQGAMVQALIESVVRFRDYLHGVRRTSSTVPGAGPRP